MKKLVVEKIVRSLEVVEIPDFCPNPKCRADFTGTGSITEGAYTYGDCEGHIVEKPAPYLEIDRSTLEPTRPVTYFFEGEGSTEFAYDEVHPISYRCTLCGQHLAGEKDREILEQTGDDDHGA